MQLNASRIKVLQAQDDLVNEMKEAASKELLRVGGHHHHHFIGELVDKVFDHNRYKKILKELIVQVSTINSTYVPLHSIIHLMTSL